jgi:hypothetical protein
MSGINGGLSNRKPTSGLFSAGIETYWKDTTMEDLRNLLERDIARPRCELGPHCEVVYPGFAGNEKDAERAGQALRRVEGDLAVMYHATSVDDDMSVAFLRELGDIYSVLLFSQGPPGLGRQYTAIDRRRSGGRPFNRRCWHFAKEHDR